MADDHLPTVEVAATPDNFPAIAESAGLRLKEATMKHMESVSTTSGFEPLPMEPYQDDVRHVMEDFEAEIFPKRHPNRKLEWVEKIFVSVKAIPYHESNTSSEMGTNDKREGAWFLALYVGNQDRNKIGRSFSLLKRFNVEKSDIYLGYKVL